MPRVLVVTLLLAAACGRREVGTGNWTGVARPDAAASPGPPRDEGAVAKGLDAALPPSDTGSAGAGGGPPDASLAPRSPEVAAPGADNPVSAHVDASTDTGDARSCPESGQCD
jgi:hypothetical protein